MRLTNPMLKMLLSLAFNLCNHKTQNRSECRGSARPRLFDCSNQRRQTTVCTKRRHVFCLSHLLSSPQVPDVQLFFVRFPAPPQGSSRCVHLHSHHRKLTIRSLHQLPQQSELRWSRKGGGEAIR